MSTVSVAANYLEILLCCDFYLTGDEMVAKILTVCLCLSGGEICCRAVSLV